MKRLDNVFSQICDFDNLCLADINACKNKQHKREVIEHAKDWENNLIELRKSLLNKTFRTSTYKVFTIYEPKERIIYMLPYYPDRILHHAIMNVLEIWFVRQFTVDTFSSIRGRGIYGAFKAVQKALLNINETQYCLKLDIKKFYPSVDNNILKKLLLRKVKDGNLIWLLNEIIDSVEGLPIGNYLSQYLANFYLTGFDHWLKEVKRVKYYFRYADDIVILSDSKIYLHQLLIDIKEYLLLNLKLEVKSNYQIFSVEVRGIDFVGYVFRHKYILLRKSIKQNFCRMIKRNKNKKSLASYNGWLIHCDAKHLTKKLCGN